MPRSTSLLRDLVRLVMHPILDVLVLHGHGFLQTLALHIALDELAVLVMINLRLGWVEHQVVAFFENFWLRVL